MMSSETLAQLLDSSRARSQHRCCFLLQVKPEKLTEYVSVHQRVWPQMRQALSESGWRHYSLFLDPETGLVVGYFEAENIKQAITAISNTDVNRRWQTEMKPFFAEPDGGENHFLSQYFYLE